MRVSWGDAPGWNEDAPLALCGDHSTPPWMAVRSGCRSRVIPTPTASSHPSLGQRPRCLVHARQRQRRDSSTGGPSVPNIALIECDPVFRQHADERGTKNHAVILSGAEALRSAVEEPSPRDSAGAEAGGAILTVTGGGGLVRYARHDSHRLRPDSVSDASLRSGRKASRNSAQHDGGFVTLASARRAAHSQRPMIALTLPAAAGILRP